MAITRWSLLSCSHPLLAAVTSLFSRRPQRSRSAHQFNMVQFTARGIVPPVFTPLKDDFSIDFEAIPPYAQFLANSNIKAILVGGTTGEGPAFSLEERKRLTEAWVAAAAPLRLHVMVQVGGAPLPDVVALAAHAESVKADSLLTLPELFFRPADVEGLVSYLETVGRAAPNTPLLYYHFPASSNVSLNMAQLIPAATARVPTFRGIKFTSNELSEAAAALRSATGDQAVFLGADSLWAPALLLGFDSAIGTTFNLVPALAHDIVSAVRGNDNARARELQERLNDFCNVLTPEGPWVVVMKAAMEIVTGIKVGPPRLPQRPLSAEQTQRIRDRLRALGFAR